MQPKANTIPVTPSAFSASPAGKPAHGPARFPLAMGGTGRPGPVSGLIVNADDWGRDRETTERTFECVRHGTVSAVSAMVFMDDSERSAAVALEAGIDAGLHLNFTERLSAKDCPARIAERQREIGVYLLRHPLAQIVYHPGLARSFEYVVAAQLDEYQRLYGAPAQRIDGHHHMHLCTNVLVGKLLPAGTIVRRNFSFRAGEKSLVNRLYRKAVDRRVGSRHLLVDCLYNLSPLEPARLERILKLATEHVVELETHPINPAEYEFLMGDGLRRSKLELLIGPFPYRLSNLTDRRSR